MASVRYHLFLVPSLPQLWHNLSNALGADELIFLPLITLSHYTSFMSLGTIRFHSKGIIVVECESSINRF